jgi:hypothetical protein
MSRTNSGAVFQFLPSTTRTETPVSRVTKWRQRKYGYCFAEEKLRTTGKDGKSYPRFKRGYKTRRSSPVLLKLRQARYYLRKADYLGSTSGIQARELSAMDAIQSQVAEILTRWRRAEEVK